MSQSAARYEIVPATMAHVCQLSAYMRKADVEECWASSRRRPYEALLSSLQVSRDPQAGIIGGYTAAMWGVAPATLLSDVGRPWLLASDEFVKHARRFLRKNREYIASILPNYSLLENWVDARNAASIRWLRWLGFDILPAEPVGPDKVPFHRFVMVRPCVTPQL